MVLRQQVSDIMVALSRFDHQQSQKPELNEERGIIYAGLSLSCCLVEIFGDDEND